jgi:hypothetical protein
VIKKTFRVCLALLILSVLLPLTPAIASSTAKPVACMEPQPGNAQYCRELERQILSSTVRFTIKGWAVKPGGAGYKADYSIGHGTVMEGRYLVTHNHFHIPFSGEPWEGPKPYGMMISLYNSDGQRVFRGPLSDFEAVVEAGETRVLRHKDEGFFEALGFRSARFGGRGSPPIETGMEVAQVDWDGTTTRVDWVEVKEIDLEAGTPRLVLDDAVRPGASGGGIFWQGIHLANNWQYQAKIDESDMAFDEVTVAALNPQSVLDLFGISED